MDKHIVMLAKMALIKAAAQIHITTANFISKQTNNQSNATYAMSNEGEQTLFEDFKKEIERHCTSTNKFLNIEDPQDIEKTIQEYIENEEGITLALYIANQWGIISELGWKSDEVSKYVQRCLRGLYNSTQQDNTILGGSPYHKEIAAAIESLKNTIDNNIQRALLRDIFYPRKEQSNLKKVLDNA